MANADDGKAWSYSTGLRGSSRVRVYEHGRTQTLYLEYADGPTRSRTSLGHRDRVKGRRQAAELSRQLANRDPNRPAPVSMQALFDNYGQVATPLKGPSKQGHDRSAAKLWLDVLGGTRLAHTLTSRDALRFIQLRRAGGSRRRRRKDGKNLAPAAPIEDRIIEYDLKYLRGVLRWALGAGLLERDPLAGFRFKVQTTPRRPIVTTEQYEALVAVAGDIHPLFKLAVVLCRETGHRISAVRQLRWADIDLEHEAVHWRAANDKSGFDHTTPLSAASVAALRDARRSAGIISLWVFPLRENPAEPLTRYTLAFWWKEGERRAGIPHQRAGAWHQLRRLFASELKGQSLRDVAMLGGWKNPTTLLTLYQRADVETMRGALAARQRVGLVS